MSIRIVYVSLAVIAVALFVVLAVNKPSEAPRPGVVQEDHGGEHVAAKDYSGDEPPTSGDHSNTLPWGVYEEEVSDVNMIHNLEHGGIFISYNESVSEAEIAKIVNLFSIPSSKKDFNPAKAVVAPRAANKAAITMSSWNRSEEFLVFDEAAMYEYYARNIGKSPEPFGS